jgi:hypothetical protein
MCQKNCEHVKLTMTFDMRQKRPLHNDRIVTVKRPKFGHQSQMELDFETITLMTIRMVTLTLTQIPQHRTLRCSAKVSPRRCQPERDPHHFLQYLHSNFEAEPLPYISITIHYLLIYHFTLYNLIY